MYRCLFLFYSIPRFRSRLYFYCCFIYVLNQKFPGILFHLYSMVLILNNFYTYLFVLIFFPFYFSCIFFWFVKLTPLNYICICILVGILSYSLKLKQECSRWLLLTQWSGSLPVTPLSLCIITKSQWAYPSWAAVTLRLERKEKRRETTLENRIVFIFFSLSSWLDLIGGIALQFSEK